MKKESLTLYRIVPTSCLKRYSVCNLWQTLRSCPPCHDPCLLVLTCLDSPLPLGVDRTCGLLLAVEYGKGYDGIHDSVTFDETAAGAGTLILELLPACLEK